MHYEIAFTRLFLDALKFRKLQSVQEPGSSRYSWVCYIPYKQIALSNWRAEGFVDINMVVGFGSARSNRLGHAKALESGTSKVWLHAFSFL